MSEPTAYEWDYEKGAADDRTFFTTISVGVFQWLPKSSGKGVKRSKTIRVCGYGSDAKSVYAKAEDLCEQLNKSGASSENPPSWLQKQYSVPKPSTLVIPRTYRGLTGSQVRSIRIAQMKEILLPEGFVTGKDSTYIRRIGEQIHLVNFQASRWGHEFTINLAFHNIYVPPLVTGSNVSISELFPLECMLTARIGHFLPEKRDTWFNYGSDRDALKDIFRQWVKRSLEVFDESARKWADLNSLIAEVDSGRYCPWSAREEDLVVACIAMRLGKFDVAEARLQKSKQKSHSNQPLHAKLTKKLMELRAAAKLEIYEMPNWIPD